MWTKDPPTEPGWYWWRDTELIIDNCNQLFPVHFDDPAFTKNREPNGEWWTVRIPKPCDEPK